MRAGVKVKRSRKRYKNAKCAEIDVSPTHPGKANRILEELKQLRSAAYLSFYSVECAETGIRRMVFSFCGATRRGSER